jgi:hypothetical protein
MGLFGKMKEGISGILKKTTDERSKEDKANDLLEAENESGETGPAHIIQSMQARA